MNLKRNILLRDSFALFIATISIHSYGQQNEKQIINNPPINVETLLGSRGLSFQMITDKKNKSYPRLGFFSVTDIDTDWGEKNKVDVMTQSNLTLDLVKGIRINTGFHYTAVTGIRPSTGFIYSYVTDKLIIIAVPRIDIQKDSNIECFLLTEYQPLINDKLHFYSRLQGLYAQMTKNGDHGRSYFRVRIGLSYKEFSFGLGANIEYYGVMKHNENNIGLFSRILLF